MEVHDTPQSLIGYQGDRRVQKANIIVRRKYVGSMSNDIGFLKQDNGTYKLIISEYDVGIKKAKDFTERLKQLYGKQKVVKQARRMGYTIRSQKTDNDGKLRIRLMAR